MKKKNLFNCNGFTLIELLIAMAITWIVSAAIFTAFQSQQKSYLVQEDTAAMQQNLRAGMDTMVREIRMAGYDPLFTDDNGDGFDESRLSDGLDNDADGTIDNAGENVRFGITTAGPYSITFTMDITGGEADGIDNDGDGLIDEPNEHSDGDTGDSNENITFGFSNANDSNGDGIADNGAADLGRNTGGGFQSTAENIHAIEFFYTLADGSTSLAPANLADIRSVQITMLARAERADRKFVDTQGYATPGGQAWGPYNDNFRRRLLTTTVKCRNLGL